jgi:hypothetical protein
MSCQFLPKLSIRLLPIFTQIIHKYPKFSEQFKNLSKKAKTVVCFIYQYEYVYVLSKQLFYSIEDSTTRIMNLEMY